MLRRLKSRALSLIEVLVAFLVLLVAVLTMVGYTTTVHRAAKEGKRQALASMEARSMLERIRDAPSAFTQAVTPEGLGETKLEYLLDSEPDDTKNEQGRMAAAEFRVLGRADQVAGEIYKVVVTVLWSEDGRERQVVLESRMIRTDF